MTFDVYLAILPAVQCRVNQALGRDDPNWRLQHYCPACTFKVCSPTLLPLYLIVLLATR